MRRSASPTAAGAHLDQRVVGLGPADNLADVDLVAAERARHLLLASRKNRARPMNDAT